MSNRKHLTATVSGLRVRNFTSTEGKKEDSLGQVKLALIADKEELKVNEVLGILTINDVISALSMSQAARDEVEIKLTFTVPEDEYNRIMDARGSRKGGVITSNEFDTDD